MRKGLMRLDEKTQKLVLIDETDVNVGFIEEIGGVVYVGTGKGLMRLDEKTQKLVLVDKTNVVGGFMKEIGGVVYVGTQNDGLMILDEKTKWLVSVESTFRGQSKTDVKYGFMEEIGGVVYVGTTGKGLMRLDEKTQKLVLVDGTDVEAGFMEEIGGVVYVGTQNDGLMRLDEKTKKLVLVDETDVEAGFMEEIGGVVYVGAQDHGLMRLDFANVQKANDKFLKQIFKGIKIQNQGQNLVSKIAKKIKDIDSLKKYTGIEIQKLNRYSTLKLINATSNGKTGIVNLKIILNVGGREQTINIPLQGKSDNEIIANNDQKYSKEIIEDILDNLHASIINQGTRKVSNIASNIKDIAALKNITGIDLSNLAMTNSTISSISAVGNTNGVLTISIKIFTKNATQQELKISKDIQGKSDMKVDAEIATEIANEKQPLNITKFKEQFNTHKKLLHQSTKTVGDIAKEINSGYDIEYKIFVIKK